MEFLKNLLFFIICMLPIGAVIFGTSLLGAFLEKKIGLLYAILIVAFIVVGSFAPIDLWFDYWKGIGYFR